VGNASQNSLLICSDLFCFVWRLLLLLLQAFGLYHDGIGGSEYYAGMQYCM
jgi:hypothetical protein